MENKLIKNDFIKVDSCCICKSKEINKILDMGKTALANNLVKDYKYSLIQKKYDLCLIICKKCNHIQLNTSVNEEILFNNYAYKTGISNTMINHFKSFTEHLCKYFDVKNQSYSKVKVLDIGSNDSVLLDILSKKGFKTFGVEPASNLADQSSHNIFNGFFNKKTLAKISKQFGNFDVITANNVFAHTRDLPQFIENMSLLLKKDGLISIEVQYLPELIKNCYVDMIYHEHTSYHHLKPLHKLFKDNNLTLNSVSNISTHGGSMRIILNKSNKNSIEFDNKIRSLEFIKNDNEFDDNIINKFNLLSLKIDDIKSTLNKKIREVLRECEILYGYSAPAKTVTLLSLLDVDIIKKIEFIIEDNPLKQGNYIPSTNIPLLKTSEGTNKIKSKKSSCIIFAWNMFDEISKKIINNPRLNPNILICPLPYPKIIRLDYAQNK
tara:strand:- start:1202 stop:2512 length:1311 start_codon:yes stop_codon:yes gene_type:complete